MENEENGVVNLNDTENEQISQENEENPSTETDNPSENVIDDANDDNETNNDGDVETYTKDKVNEIVRQRLERQKSSLFKRYGVGNKKELDDLITKAKSYEIMKEAYDEQGVTISDLSEKLAFIENNINPVRYDDVKAYFKGKGIDFNSNSLKQELETHPEWVNVAKNPLPTTTFKNIGVEHKSTKIEESEEERMKRVFGI